MKMADSLDPSAQANPIFSLEELCQELRAPIVPGDIRQLTYSEIILGGLVRLNETSELKNGTLSINVTAPKNIERSKLRLAVKAFYSQIAPLDAL